MYHIVLNCDDNYLKYAAVLISNIVKMTNKSFSEATPPPPPHIACDNASLNQKNIQNYPNKPYCFHIISDFISQENIEKLKILESNLATQYPCEIKIHIIDDSIFKNLDKWGFENNTELWGIINDTSLATYYVFFIDKILPKEVNKALYIDVDMLVLCDIRELFAIDLKDKVIASSSGYTKLSVVSMAFKSCRDNKEIIADFTNYFCEGLMLINMQEWRKQNIDSKCIEFLQEYRPEYADQDALNYFVQDAIDLGSNWGVLIYQYITWSFSNPAKIKKEYKHIFDNIKIIHCNGTAKPWTNFYLLADSHIRALVFDNWWDIALHNTFGFTQDFNTIRTQLKQEELSYCMNTILRMINQPDTRIEKMIDNINKRVNNLDSKVWKIRHPHKVFRNFLKKLFSKN